MAKRIMRRFRLHEISAVDNPAQEHAKVTIFKREDQDMPWTAADAHRHTKAADTPKKQHRWATVANAALADGKDEGAAIRIANAAVGKSDDDPAAKVMGLFLGERLAKARDALLASVKSILGDYKADKDELVDKTVDQFVDHVADLSADSIKAMSGGDPDDPPSEDEMNVAAMKKVLGLADSATEQDVIAAVTKLAAAETHAKDDEIAKLKKEGAEKDAALALAKAGFSNEEQAFYNNLTDAGAKDAFLKGDKADRMVQMQKREPELLELAKAVQKNKEYEKRIAHLEEQTALEKFKKEAIDIGLPEAEAPTLMKLAKTDPAAYERMKGFTKSAIAAAKEGGLFKEFGATGRTEPMTAYEELTAKAKDLQKAEPKLSFSQAFNKVYTNPDNAELAKKERLENRGRMTTSAA